ncbi:MULTISPECIES: SIMPL domain-containing protein [Pontibacillus]|uniref:SIMPL domain-containing protein n=1 Tax=Pontibacillus chungwhensis TaxID=265426 RepID=A0ABY8UXX2_9BACI|nr:MULTISPECIES: SIMPL domain-containing protein [Pontibacillus]MCD5325811.1 SIMPL domain-containing protein [Pontibacillus sp. HN14]WIF98344.1 SIMPL domain-containing protein [Pontibacillus chungwhensis]
MYYPSPQPQYRDNQRQANRFLTVTGIGSVKAQPDIANITLGVETQDKELTTAQQTNAQTLNEVIDALIQIGIPNENIQTVDYFIFPQYDYIDGKQQFRGYEVTHLITVTIENLEQTGEVIDTAVANGANRVSNISFTVQDPQSFYQQALASALQNANTKAQTIAQTMNLQIDMTPFSIDEQVPPTQATPQTFVKAESVGATSTPVEPGQLEITARVETKYQYIS